VEALAEGASAPTFLLQPTGKVDAWLRATRLGVDAVLLDVDSGWGEAVHARLRRFLLRTKAELEPGRWSGWALRGPGARGAATARPLPSAAVAHDAPWPGVEAVDLLGPDGVAAPDLPVVDAAAVEALRIEVGVPALGVEVDDGTIPGELGQWAIDASVSFTKGCYTGQELVARIDSRGGNVPRPLRGVVLDAEVAAGTPVLLGGAEVGRLTSVAVSPTLGPVALAVVARSVEPGAAVQAGAARGRVVELPLR
jgi:folate-binding protein YgfZ